MIWMTKFCTQFDPAVWIAWSRCPVPRCSSVPVVRRGLEAGGTTPETRVSCSLSSPQHLALPPVPLGWSWRCCAGTAVPGGNSGDVVPCPQHQPARSAALSMTSDIPQMRRELCLPLQVQLPGAATSTLRAPVLTVSCLCCNSLLCLLLLCWDMLVTEKTCGPVGEGALSDTGRSTHHIMTVMIHQ